MSFLKKLGSIVLQGGAIVQNFLPFGAQVAGMFNPGLGLTLGELSGIIGSIEVAGQALGTTGPDRLKAAVPLVTQAVLQTVSVSGHKVKDQELFAKATAEFAQATADLLNSLDESGVVVAKG